MDLNPSFAADLECGVALSEGLGLSEPSALPKLTTLGRSGAPEAAVLIGNQAQTWSCRVQG